MGAHTSPYGRIVILNGAPRSGKSSIARAIQHAFDGVWINMGVDHFMRMIPDKFQPGIGLRPGGERPDLEPAVAALYEGLYMSIAAHSRLGINIVADVGHHDCYSSPLNILPHCAGILEAEGLAALFIGVKCPIEEIMRRRQATGYPGYNGDGASPAPVLRWQSEVHKPGIYDLEVDTSAHTPEAAAQMIWNRLAAGSFTALKALAGLRV